MRRALAPIAAGLLLGASAAAAGAQEPLRLTLSPGTQVRIESREAPGQHVVGRVWASTPDSLALISSGTAEPVSYAVPELLTLEVRGGEDRRRGVLIGAGLGAGLTVVFGGIDAARGEITAGEVGSIAVGNALIFGLVGYAFAPKGWQRLPLPSAVASAQPGIRAPDPR